jgi:hypothetical protein
VLVVCEETCEVLVIFVEVVVELVYVGTGREGGGKIVLVEVCLGAVVELVYALGAVWPVYVLTTQVVVKLVIDAAAVMMTMRSTAMTGDRAFLCARSPLRTLSLRAAELALERLWG